MRNVKPGTADALAAAAMERVLDSEQESQRRIADCEQRCQEELEQARAQRRAILERAQARIVALHTRAAGALEQRSAEILARGRQAAQKAAAPPPAQRVEAALTRLVTQLLSATPRSDGH
jgi:hypothetical protein